MTGEVTSMLGGAHGSRGGKTFRAFDPARAESIEPDFVRASPSEVERAATLAAAAAPAFAATTGADRRQLLHRLADRLDATGPELVARAMRETALPEARLRGEVARTSGQLRLYGDTAARGDWLDLRIETALPERKPLPRPDHRSMLRPLGPVVVFGSSNFPFAYSVAGGDTASALAAGCPVIVKAHPAHPGTSALVGRLVVEAVAEAGLPAGTFALLFDDGFEVGQALVRHPAVAAVGFTGSLRGGRALADLAAARPVPIPVYAEMGSINPVFILPGALAERAPAIVEGLHASATLGVGQFCTKPGLIVLQRSPEAEAFVRALAAKLTGTPEAAMLTAGIRKNFLAGTTARAASSGVGVVARTEPVGACAAAPVWFETGARTFLAQPELSAEIFGPSSLVVWCADADEMHAVAEHLEGNLTATVHAAGLEAEAVRGLVSVLAARAGRVILNGYPTGLEVSSAIVHGGPYPATSDGGRSTSVGTRALLRWARLVCYQNFTEALLPPELRNANPLGLRRLVNGEWSNDSIG